MDLAELDALLSVLRKHGVEVFDGQSLKIRLRPYVPGEPDDLTPEVEERD